MDFMDSIDDAGSAQMRHVVLHLVYPDSFERIASGTDKRNVVSIFNGFVTDPDADDDRKLFSIRAQLEASLENSDLDFYEAPLVSVWKDSGKSVEAGIALDALRFKRQVILYGPPGTGKTFSAKQLAETILRSALVKALGPKEYFKREKSGELADQVKTRTHRVQFHPAYGYEDFIRGLHLDKHGATVYRLGRLPKIIDAMRADSLGLPHVLILDEINRTDLSRTLGECFSLLEDRDQPVELPAHDDEGSVMTLTLPKQLYVIGTMNLIDQSVEQIDFALRRRFLWVRCGYDAKALVSASQAIWERTPGKSITWDRVASDFQLLASATTALNRRIHDSEFLGQQYEIGHTYLLDAVSFLKDELGKRPRTFLWNSNGTAKQPVRKLWNLSLRPLLHEYLAGLDPKTREDELRSLEAIFLQVPPT
jgi:5-methylcytosine-specific restriction protein B